MPNRTTKVTLTAQVSDYISGMEKAAQKTQEVAKGAQKLKEQEKIFNEIGKASLAVGTLAAVGVGLAVKKFAEFDQAMSNVQAATHESTENMGLLRDAALKAGQDTAFSATEAASAVEELAKAGIKTRDVLGGGLKGALDLAAAGQLEVGTAAEIAASALTQFNLQGADVPHVADLLAAGAGKAQGSVEDMGAALNQAGLVASQMGLSVEETTGSLAAFASAGLTGSDAGTSFRSALLRLANPTDEAKKAMQDLGIEAYNAGGQFVGIESLAGQLQDRLGGLTQAQRDQTLALVFGQDAIRVANILYKEGSSGIADWTKQVDDSGYAAETANQRMDNLAGDIEKLGGAFDTALIKTGSAANDVLRGIVQTAESAVDAFGNAPQGVQTTTLVLGGLTAAVGLAGGGFLLAVPKIAAFKAALATMSPGAQRAAGVLGGIAKGAGLIAGLGLAVSILDKLAVGSNKAAPGIERIIAALNDGELDGAFENASKGADSLIESLELVEGSSFDSNMERIGEALGGPLGITGQVTEARAGFVALDGALAQLAAGGKGAQAEQLFAKVAAAAQEQGISLEKVKKLFPEYANALAGVTNESEDATGNSEDLAGGIDGVGTAADDAKDKIQELADIIRGFGDTQLSVNDANRAVEESLDAFTASVAENGQTLDITTEEGRKNQEALDAIAQAYKESAAATVENTGKQEDAIPIIQQGRDEIIKAGEAAGLSKDEAEKYADSLGLIPGNVATEIELNRVAEAIAAAELFAEKLNAIPNSKEVYLYVQEQKQVLGVDQEGQTLADGGRVLPHLAGGSPMWWRDGVVKGPGGPREDRVRAMLSPGEFVVNADATSKHLALLSSINSGSYAPASSGPSGASSPDLASNMSASIVPQLLREVRDSVRRGLAVPMPAVQSSIGSSNVSTSTRGRGY